LVLGTFSFTGTPLRAAPAHFLEQNFAKPASMSFWRARKSLPHLRQVRLFLLEVVIVFVLAVSNLHMGHGTAEGGRLICIQEIQLGANPRWSRFHISFTANYRQVSNAHITPLGSTLPSAEP